MSEKIGISSIIKNSSFKALWTNQILVALSCNTLNFALIIWVFKLVGTNLSVSLLMLAIYLPAVLFSVLAGIVVDRVDRKKIILVIDLLLAIAFLLFVFVKGSFLLILLNTFLINSLAQFFMPSESSSIPMLVPQKQLFLANSLFSLTLYGAIMVGYSVGGPMLNQLGVNSVFIFGSGLLFLAFLVSHRLPQIRAVQSDGNNLLYIKPKQLINLINQECSQTFSFIKDRLNLAGAIVLMSMVQAVIGMLAVMMPGYMETVLKIHAADSSYFVMLPLGLGAIIGALFVGRFCQKLPRRTLVIPAIIWVGTLFILIGLAPWIAKTLIAADLPETLTRPRYFFRAPSLSFFFGLGAFLLGVCTAAMVIPCQTVLHEHTTKENRGKIFAVLYAAMMGLSAITVLVAGGLSDIFGVLGIFVGLGVFSFIIGLLVKAPDWFFKEDRLSFKLREFLGLGHWEKT